MFVFQWNRTVRFSVSWSIWVQKLLCKWFLIGISIVGSSSCRGFFFCFCTHLYQPMWRLCHDKFSPRSHLHICKSLNKTEWKKKQVISSSNHLIKFTRSHPGIALVAVHLEFKFDSLDNFFDSGIVTKGTTPTK